MDDANPRGIRLDGKARIILAAEELFAINGIEGVSLRQIAARSGQGNHHAVQYHFGAREALVQAIFDYRMLQMEPIRREMLETARVADRLADARALMEIVFVPQLFVVDSDGNNHYAAFLSQYLQRSHGDSFGDFGSPLPPVLSEVLGLLRRRLEHLSESVAQRRLMSACFMFLNILSSYSAGRLSDDADHDFEKALDDTIDQMVAATCAPYGAEAGRLRLPSSTHVPSLAEAIQAVGRGAERRRASAPRKPRRDARAEKGLD